MCRKDKIDATYYISIGYHYQSKMRLVKSNIQQDKYSTIYVPSEPVVVQTRVAKMEVIKGRPYVKEEIIGTKKSTFAFDFLGLFTTTTNNVKMVTCSDDKWRQRCIITPEMRAVIERVRTAIHLIKPHAEIDITEDTLHADWDEPPVEGQKITVSLKVTEMKFGDGLFRIGWVHLPPTATNV